MQAELVAHVHLDVPSDDGRSPFGVEADEVEARAGLAGDGVGPRRAVLEELRQESPVRRGHRRSTDRRVRQHGVHRRFREVVEPVVFGGRAVPVPNIGLVPQLPLPGALDARVAGVDVRGPGPDERAPFRVVLGRVETAAVQRVDARVLVRRRRRGGRHRLRHEGDLVERKRARARDGVHDPVHQRPAVDRVAGGVLGVGVGRPPFERRRAVPGVEQEVRAHVRRGGVGRGQRLQQRLPGRGGRVVRLVVAVIRPNAFERRSGRRRVDRNVDRRGGLGRACAITRCSTISPQVAYIWRFERSEV